MDMGRRLCTCAVDGGVAIGVAAFAILAAHVATPGAQSLDLFAHLLIVVGTLALIARRQWPLAVLTVTASCVLMYQAIGYPGVMTTLPVLVAVYTSTSAGYRRATVAIIVAGLCVTSIAVSTIDSLHRPMRELAEAKFLLIGWMLAGGIMAEMSRHRRAYIQQVEERAIEAERTREETARRRASEERLRIARELHDSLTHSISIVKVQAGVAIHLARKRGEEVPDALLAIEDASTEAIRELRATLEVLRRPPDDEQPGSGLDRLPDLVERARTAGFDATVDIAGHQRSLPAEVDQAAYRIVQEALTNVWRHAGANTADVRIEYGDDELTVQIDDDGKATPDLVPIPGVGLIGMRERVTALGGQLRAGPRPTGGFRVRASLPLADSTTDVAQSSESPFEPTADRAVPVAEATLPSTSAPDVLPEPAT